MSEETGNNHGTRVPAGNRGGTRIADRVVAGIATQAAKEALRSGPDAAGRPRGKGTAPEASVTVYEQTSTRIRISLQLGYPSDIGAQCSAVRSRVTERISELTGLTAAEVAVDVEQLHSRHTGGGGGGRVR